MEVLKTRRDINIVKRPDPLQYTFTGDSEYKRTRHGWLLTLKSDGELTILSNTKVDIFAVGGGGGAWYAAVIYPINKCSGAAAGGGGYTETISGYSPAVNAVYTATIGAGGNAGTHTDGGTTSLVTGTTTVISAFGGTNGSIVDNSKLVGGNGGSGGSVYLGVKESSNYAVGGSNGSDGATCVEEGPASQHTAQAGSGQGSTTRAFGDSDGDLYATGGYAYPSGSRPEDDPTNIPNSGNGATLSFIGCSGVILIRNH